MNQTKLPEGWEIEKFFPETFDATHIAWGPPQPHPDPFLSGATWRPHVTGTENTIRKFLVAYPLKEKEDEK